MSDWMTLRSWLRGCAPSTRRAHLAIESLEQRLAPSASSDFRGIIGLDAAQAAYPYRGQGYSVAILDTGINYNDPNLGGGWGKRVIAGYNFVNNTSDPMDDNGHGTFVAGEIASSSTLYPGIAPDVNLIALKVLDANADGTWANIDAGLKWVIAHQAQYHIVAVNLSLGAGNYTADIFSLLETELATLKQDGIFTAVASGNDFATDGSTPGLDYPAVDPDVVSVGATWAGNFGTVSFYGATDNTTAPNQIAGFTQRDANLSLLAPGAWLTGEALNGGYTQMGGTSMAAAVVTGSAVVLHQALDAAGLSADTSESDILNLMQSTGLAIKDNFTGSNAVPTGLTFRQVNLKAALDSVASLAGPPVLAPIANQTIGLGGSVTVPLSASDPTGAPFTETATVVDLPALAYQLNQQLGLSYTGSYYTDKLGYNEKWLYDRNHNSYFILPDGEFRRFTGSMTTSLLAVNLVATFDPTYYANPKMLWYTPYVAFPPVSVSIANNAITVRSTSATWTGTVPVQVTASNGAYAATQTFSVNVALPAAVVAPPVIAPLPNLTVKHSQNPLLVPLSATDPAGRAVTFSAQILPVGGQTPAVSATITGNQLRLSPAAAFLGAYTVAVTARNGVASVTSTFTVTVTDVPPQLAAVSVQSLNAGQTTLQFPISATDADGDTLAYSATVVTPSASLYQLQQQLHLGLFNGQYYTNTWGYGDKWLISPDGTWYGLFPGGKLYRWTGSITTTMQPANLVATLDPSVYLYPQLLWNAQPPIAPAFTISMQGNQLTVQRPATLTGVFQIQVTASDGAETATQTFWLTLN
jgi:Subtilase family